MTKTQKQKIQLNAQGKKIGRLASAIANILNGKHSPEYAPNTVPEVIVEVTNVSAMRIDEKKKKGKVYDRYTGYFGGRRERTLGQVLDRKGYEEVLRRAVRGMLPANRLRKVKMKQLQITH